MNKYYSQQHVDSFPVITDKIAYNAYYYPILKEFNVPAIIYVITKFIGNKFSPWWIKLDDSMRNNRYFKNKNKRFFFLKIFFY